MDHNERLTEGGGGGGRLVGRAARRVVGFLFGFTLFDREGGRLYKRDAFALEVCL